MVYDYGIYIVMAYIWLWHIYSYGLYIVVAYIYLWPIYGYGLNIVVAYYLRSETEFAGAPHVSAI